MNDELPFAGSFSPSLTHWSSLLPNSGPKLGEVIPARADSRGEGASITSLAVIEALV